MGIFCKNLILHFFQVHLQWIHYHSIIDTSPNSLLKAFLSKTKISIRHIKYIFSLMMTWSIMLGSFERSPAFLIRYGRTEQQMQVDNSCTHTSQCMKTPVEHKTVIRSWRCVRISFTAKNWKERSHRISQSSDSLAMGSHNALPKFYQSYRANHTEAS